MGRKKEEGIGRVRLLGCGPTVSKETDKTLRLWRDVYQVPIGRAIDAMLEYIKAHPDFKIPKKNWNAIPPRKASGDGEGVVQ
jgi:hypothetical protein